jgi:pimeloyl-ACP methyl ester carboxylesterase
MAGLHAAFQEGKQARALDMDEVLIKDWRRLAVRQWGVPDGDPVFLLHGTPGSRLGTRPTDEELGRLCVRLITYDRPGYGLSGPHYGRSVGDAAADVEAIADHLGIERFAVIGRSGGGPHALACAALLPDRVTRAASLVGLAPFEAAGLDWMRGMAEMNREHYLAALQGPGELASVLYPHVVAMRSNPEHLVRRLEAEGHPEDVARLSDPEHREELVLSMTEAINRSLAGWAADSLAFTRPWGFDPRWIRTPTLIWHATRDVFSPVSHARWLADRIKSSVLLLADGSSHLRAAEAQYGAVRWLLHGGEPESVAG